VTRRFDWHAAWWAIRRAIFEVFVSRRRSRYHDGAFSGDDYSPLGETSMAATGTIWHGCTWRGCTWRKRAAGMWAACRLLAVSALCGLCASAPAQAVEPPAAQPNIVLFLIDDLGWTDLGFAGSTLYRTPHVDHLAQQGMRFTAAYSACTVCSPTRAAVLAGKYPARLHLTDWIAGHQRPFAKLQIPAWRQFLPLEEVTIAEALKRADYATATIGKWHLGGEPYAPEKQGFDLNFGGDHRGQPPSYFFPYGLPGVTTGAKGEYLTDRLTDESLRFIDAHRERPFFLYFPHYAVHTPIQAPAALVEKYRARVKPGDPHDNAAYAAMIEAVDQSVGRVLARLDELKLTQRTIVIFTSDNGGNLGGGRQRITSNAPLRLGKGSAYEGGVRVPLVVRWPGVTRAGSTCDVPVISVDLYPTLLSAAGIAPQSTQVLDGESLVPLLKEAGELKRDAIYWHYPHYHPGSATPYGAVRQGDYKLIEFYEDGHLELYNLKDDLSESHDLASRQPQRAADMRRKLDDWRRQVAAQMPTPNPNYDPARDRK
jgi:arylsulfatase A